MSLEHSPARHAGSASGGDGGNKPKRRNIEELLKPKEAADLLGLSLRGLENFRHRGGGPAYVRISARCVRYRYGTILDYAAARTFASTADEAA